MAHQKHVTSALDLFGKSYEIVKKNLVLFVLLSSVSIVSSLISAGQAISNDKTEKSGWQSVATSALGPELDTSGYASLGILVLLFTVVGVVFMLMMLILSLRAAQGKTPTFDILWKEFRQKGLKLFLLVICLAIALLVGFILLIIPGVILLWRLSMAPYIMIDKGTDISESFVQSWEMTRSYAWPVYSIFLVSILLAVTNLVPIIGSLIALALGIAYTCAMPLRYEELKHHLKP